MLEQQNTKGHWGGCVGKAEYYRSPSEAVLVQQNNIGALGRLCWYSRVLVEHTVCCVGRAQCYRSTREAVLVRQSTIGALGSLSWYSRIL